MTPGADLVAHLARFGRALRARGVEVGVGDEVDATRALALVDLLDRLDVHQALRAALKIRRRDWQTFDELFAALWSGAPRDVVPRPAAARPIANPGVRLAAGTSRPALEDLAREERTTAPDGGVPGYSSDVLLRRKPIDACSPDDLAAMTRLIAHFTPRLATRRSRRLERARTGGTADPRRSFRRAVSTGGEMLSLARRRRRVERPHLVVLCDTSGSMQPHAAFVLAFAIALRRVVRRLEVFAFNTSLTRVTPWLVPGRIQQTLDRLAGGVPDWSGGTKIGESLSDFVARYGDQVLTSRTVVVIVSDGLDRGDTTQVARAMRHIRSKARRVVWLNPLSGDPRYEPTARAMQAALPFIDRLAPAHDVASLERAFVALAI